MRAARPAGLPRRRGERPGAQQREAIELKAGPKQLDGYLDRFRLDTGTLIIFDRRPTVPSITDRTGLSKETTPSGRVITLLRA